MPRRQDIEIVTGTGPEEHCGGEPAEISASTRVRRGIHTKPRYCRGGQRGESREDPGRDVNDRFRHGQRKYNTCIIVGKNILKKSTQRRNNRVQIHTTAPRDAEIGGHCGRGVKCKRREAYRNRRSGSDVWLPVITGMRQAGTRLAKRSSPELNRRNESSSLLVRCLPTRSRHRPGDTCHASRSDAWPGPSSVHARLPERRVGQA